jgi:hypothetical protein
VSWNSWTWLIMILESTILKSENLSTLNFSILIISTLKFLSKFSKVPLHSLLNYTYYIVYYPMYSRCSSYTWNHYDSTIQSYHNNIINHIHYLTTLVYFLKRTFSSSRWLHEAAFYVAIS